MALGIQAGIALGSALLGVGTGFLQRRQANRLEQNNIRPTATVNNNLLRNQALAGQLANQGMNQAQYNNAIQQQQIGLASGLRAQGLYGRGAFNANTTLRNYGNQVNQLNIADDQARLQNQRLLMNANQVVAQDEQRVWNWNKAMPYQQTAQRVDQLRGTGSNNIVGGIGTLAQAGLMGTFGGNNLLTPVEPNTQPTTQQNLLMGLSGYTSRRGLIG